jgi:hypothetical protein
MAKKFIHVNQALGGMNETQWRRLGAGAWADGYAAIGAFET